MDGSERYIEVILVKSSIKRNNIALQIKACLYLDYMNKVSLMINDNFFKMSFSTDSLGI